MIQTLTVTEPNIEIPGALGCTCSTSNDVFQVGLETCQKLCAISENLEEADKIILLRSALVFACSTLDSVGKSLTKDCLEEIINYDEGAQKTFEQYISRQIKKDPHVVLARALSKPDYRGELIQVLKESVEGSSLQSYPKIAELLSRFGIESDKVISKAEAEPIFDNRQQVIHELDIMQDGSGEQRERAADDLGAQCEVILNAASKLIQLTHEKIHLRPPTIEE